TPGIQLPTILVGTTVEVNGRRASLFFVSPLQVNYVMPPETENGMATVVVRSGDGTVSTGSVQIFQVVPSVFTANSNGKGVPAALVVRVKPDNSQSFEEVFKPNPNPDPNSSNHFITKAIDLGPDNERVFLVLYVTGIRRRPSLDSVNVLIGGIEADVKYAGPQGDFVGLDQINALIPRDLIGRGMLQVAVSVDGFTTSNLV